MNAILEEARELPITALMEYLRALLQDWFWRRREAASFTKTEVTTWVDRLIRERMDEARRMEVC